MQVSVLARDGVQEAQLHLNPAQMGPISIRIALDGNQAQVDFAVDSAATRAVLESGFPELASALREAGLTLTGGGVSEHGHGQPTTSPNHGRGDGTFQQRGGDSQGQGQGQGQGQSQSRGRTFDGPADPQPQSAPARQVLASTAQVDLYA